MLFIATPAVAKLAALDLVRESSVSARTTRVAGPPRAERRAERRAARAADHRAPTTPRLARALRLAH